MNGLRPPRAITSCFTATLAALTLLLGPASPAFSQDNDSGRSPVGTHGLRLSLLLAGFTPLRSWDQLNLVPERTLLVMVGSCDLEKAQPGLGRFVRNGGAALIASDSTIVNPQALIDLCGHTVHGGKVAAWDDGAPNRGDPNVAAGTDRRNVLPVGFNWSPERILVERLPNNPPLLLDSRPEQARRPLRVATRFPSYLKRKSAELPEGTTILARFPPGCAFNGAYLPRGETPASFAVAADVEGGRLLLLADQDPLLNEYIRLLPRPGLYEDNPEFLTNTLLWLRDDRRQLVLVVVDGVIQSDLNPPRADDPAPLEFVQEKFVNFANQMLQGVQEELGKRNAVNEFLVHGSSASAGPMGGVRVSPPVFLAAIGGLAAAAVFIGYLKLRHATHREVGVPLLANAIARHSPPLSTAGHRQRQAIEEDNYGEYARALALEWFARLPGNPAATGASVAPVPPGGLPRVEAQGSWLRRLRLRNMVREVWTLATDEHPPRISRAQFQRVLHRVVRLVDAVAAGEVRLEW